ncbi:hypothetical protein PVL29_026908 [Vitis rotundifolia]|uniref:Uncharacterized protein n=1 Tax=Vitis rotundifolia TaxID=103349 RepID=A0AA39D4Q2_VITRO|nr:hypothetical protein PVL29_026908 [Vitis rotundifolia]
MVAVFNKEPVDFLRWYLITLKLREAVEAGIPNLRGTPISARSIELSEAPQHQQPNNSLQIVVNGDGENFAGETNPSDSEWVISIKEKLEQAHQDDAADSWAKLCIYRLPHYLREGDDKAYIPQIVSLGPYHHGRRRLRNMNRHKWRSLHHILKRTNHDIKIYLGAMKDLEEKARGCYEGTICLSSNEFVEMMVLDGCFILELFRGVAEGFKRLGYARNDPVFSIRGSMHSIQRDIVMLENQIPLFVLERLLGIQLGQPEQKGLVAKLALLFFEPLRPTGEPFIKSDGNSLESSLVCTTTFDPLGDQGGLHCLEVFRRSLLRTERGPVPSISSKKLSHSNRVADKRGQQLIHCVTQLREAGIKFKIGKTDCFWDIKFENGILWIPRLLIHDGTKSLFLNLIAFEQCHLDCSNDITSYVIFMDNLINSPEDVGYLHYCGIIEHWLGSESEVADLFNRLCQEVVFDIGDSYLSSLSGQVNDYYKHRWNAWRASLQQNYFSSPWTIISFLAAFVLLALTSAQTFYGIYSYYRPG